MKNALGRYAIARAFMQMLDASRTRILTDQETMLLLYLDQDVDRYLEED